MAGSREFDPLAYIENAFLDKRPAEPKGRGGRRHDGQDDPKVRFRKTALSAPRPRRAHASGPPAVLEPELKDVLASLPKNIEFLGTFFDDDVTAHYYTHEFRESRNDLIHRLIDPELTLEEASRLLGVCPTTVRRYTNKGWLAHHRTKGGQRRFRLSGVVRFVEKHGRTPQE